MDVKALGEEFNKLVLEYAENPAWLREEEVEKVKVLSQAILALEAVQRMAKPYVSPYADQPRDQWNNTAIDGGDPCVAS